ncbi:MAG TPA: hypothetical protein VHT51_04625, partial [Micropepsaceae bacterium]|nr:hypothetical protein [Micropepsaceae bacterium]
RWFDHSLRRSPPQAALEIKRGNSILSRPCHITLGIGKKDRRITKETTVGRARPPRAFLAASLSASLHA